MFSRLDDPFYGLDFWLGNWPREGQDTKAWAPLVDIHSQEDKLLLRVELPGVEKEDIQVDVEKGILTIRGEKKSMVSEGAKAHRQETLFGAFSRSFSLPDDIDSEKIEAMYKNGVLSLVLGVKIEAMPKKVTVKVL